MSRPRDVVIAAALAALVLATAATYTFHLDSAPPYLSADETHFAVHASRLAADGTDFHGNRLPIFFRITDPLAAVDRMHVWYQPFLFYLVSISLWLQPLSEWSLRLPIALVGVANVLLMFLAGQQYFRSSILGLLAAALLAITPAHFLFSRMAADYLCPLPFVLGWLWLVLRYADHRRAFDLVAAALLLGAGVYTYISSWFIMPLLALLTVIVVRPTRGAGAAAAAALAMPTLVLLPFQSSIGVVVNDVVSRYRLAGAAGGGLSQFALTERVAILWDYFNPSFLFFAGGSDLLMATSRAGLFLLPTAVLMAIGVYELFRRWSRRGLLLLGGLIAAPLPIAIALPEAPGSSTGRTLTMLVFGVLIAAGGAEAMWRRSTAGRALVVLLLAAMPLQFITFRSDYFADYLARSWVRFDPNATRDVVTAVMDLEREAPAPVILLNDDGDNKSIRWRFYTLQHRREDLWAKTKYFLADDTAAIRALLPDSLLLMRGNDARSTKLLEAGCIKIASVPAVDGEPATDIFRRAR